MLTIWGKIPSFVKVAVLVALVGVGSFFAGKHARPASVTTSTTTTTASTNTTTTNTSAQAAASAQQKVVIKYVSQKTLKQDRDSDCTEDFDPQTGKLLRRHCITKSYISSSTTAHGDSSSTSSSTSSSSSSSATTSQTQTQSTTTTTKVVQNEPSGSWKGFHVGGVASLNLLEGGKLSLDPTYGVVVSKDLFGPLSLGAAVYTDKTAVVGLGLELGKSWAVSAGAGMHFDDIAHQNFHAAFFGGSLDRHILGPIWVGVWGYSDRTAGVSASFSIP